MAGKIVVSTLNNDTGVLATQNGMTGIAKAWVYYNGNTQTINGSFNISSMTRNGAGDYTLNFTTAMPNTTYSTVGNCDSTTALNVVKVYQNASGGIVAPTTTAARVVTGNGVSNQDVTNLTVTVFSS